MKRISPFIFCCGLILLGPPAQSYTKVGNGDDGSDLEQLKPLTRGPAVDARAKAGTRLRQLNIGSVRGLGLLIPEVERAPLFMVKEDIASSLPIDQGIFHSSMSGLVYARTFAEPHAPTRFFPASVKLSSDQLEALQIHEALHRALPPGIREDEGVVSQITLAIMAPDATRDGVERAVDRAYPENDLRVSAPGGPVGVVAERPMRMNATEEGAYATVYQHPSNISYTLRTFLEGPGNPNSPDRDFPIKRLHTFQSTLYPFAVEKSPLGFGIAATLVETEKGISGGPLEFSGKLKIWSKQTFDISAWTALTINTLSAEELKNSLYGRDVLSGGVILRKNLNQFYVENLLGVDLGGQAKGEMGGVETTYTYGSVIDAKVKAGVKAGKFDLGFFGEIHLAESFKVEERESAVDLGRFRILSVGPEVSYIADNLSITLFGRVIIDATQDANFSYLGNLMGPGAARGSLGVSVAYFF